MPARDIVVVGGSAGGVTAVVDLVRALPRDLPAAVFVALHVAPDSAGLLPEILDRLGTLPAAMAHDGADVRTGRILVAPPDCHLILEQGLVRLRRTPRVNRFRPSIDVLFRSAATAYGARVAAVILSGMLDDGALGLLTVKQNGGVAIVQDTAEAAFTGMPLSALDRAPVDHVLPVAEIAAQLVELTTPRRRARAGRTTGALVGEVPQAPDREEWSRRRPGQGRAVARERPPRPLRLPRLWRCPARERRARHPAVPLPHRARLQRGEPARRPGRASRGCAVDGGARSRGGRGDQAPHGGADRRARRGAHRVGI